MDKKLSCVIVNNVTTKNLCQEVLPITKKKKHEPPF